MFYPDKIQVTDILVQRENIKLFTQVYGLIPPKSVGKKLKIFNQFNEALGLETHIQKLIVDEKELNSQIVVFKIG